MRLSHTTARPLNRESNPYEFSMYVCAFASVNLPKFLSRSYKVRSSTFLVVWICVAMCETERHIIAKCCLSLANCENGQIQNKHWNQNKTIFVWTNTNRHIMHAYFVVSLPCYHYMFKCHLLFYYQNGNTMKSNTLSTNSRCQFKWQANANSFSDLYQTTGRLANCRSFCLRRVEKMLKWNHWMRWQRLELRLSH